MHSLGCIIECKDMYCIYAALIGLRKHNAPLEYMMVMLKIEMHSSICGAQLHNVSVFSITICIGSLRAQKMIIK